MAETKSTWNCCSPGSKIARNFDQWRSCDVVTYCDVWYFNLYFRNTAEMSAGPWTVWILSNLLDCDYCSSETYATVTDQMKGKPWEVWLWSHVNSQLQSENMLTTFDSINLAPIGKITTPVRCLGFYDFPSLFVAPVCQIFSLTLPIFCCALSHRVLHSWEWNCAELSTSPQGFPVQTGGAFIKVIY